MPRTLIHQLTGPPGLPAGAGVVCGDRTAAVATWDRARVTCPGCTTPARRGHQAVALSEKALLQAVTEALTRAGWLAYHTHNSRHSPAGYPDLTCLRGNRLLCIECKSATGTLTPAQQTWLQAWRRIGGAEIYVVRPDDLPTILEVLR